MALADVRTALAALVSGAVGGALVHEYERVVNTKQELKEIATMVDDLGREIIHGWTITVESDEAVSDTEEDVPDFTFERQYTFVLRGYRGLDDAAETGKAWQTTIDAVLSAFDTAPTITATAVRSGPPESRIRDEHRFYGDYLCHYAEISLNVTLKVSRI